MLNVRRYCGEEAPDEAVRAMFAARKAVFVDLLKWDVPVLAGRFEFDRFDDEHARYLILARPDGSHLASARLLPTLRPHILDSFYAGLCDKEPPRGPGIYEITRFCLDRNLRAAQRRLARDTLVRALVDHALETGIEAYSAVAAPSWGHQVLAFGWDCRALGPDRTIGGMDLMALHIAITPETPALLAAQGIAPALDIAADAALTPTGARATFFDTPVQPTARPASGQSDR